MSHIPHRKEKDCLNCGTIVHGQYCHVCGQENVVPKESFWHMVTHFLYDITHFDTKFFETIKVLLFKPGFLTKEYMAGKRVSYLHPVKMYVFTSAVFFLLFFNFFKMEDAVSTNLSDPISAKDRLEHLRELKELSAKDSSIISYKEGIAAMLDTNRVITNKEAIVFFGEKSNILSINDNNYSNEREYDSVQRSLPAAEKDGWFLRRFSKKVLQINERYKENPEEAFKKLGNNVLHRLPYMLFVSLPLFALLLKLVYYRRKQFYYADHGVFTIHLYIFTFLVLLVVFMLGKLNDWLDTAIINWMIGALFIWLFIYLYKAMRNFYGQRRGKTIIKFLLVTLFSLLLMLILFLLFMFFSAFAL